MKLLVIGQGIAGCMAAWSLRKRGAEVWVSDKIENISYDTPTATTIAAGVLNPVTGKRYVKSWRWEEFFPLARQVYRAIEDQYAIHIWYEIPILRLLSSTEEVNNWAAREGQPDYAALLSTLPDAEAWTSLLQPGFYFGSLREAARVDFAPLLAAIRSEAVQNNQWLPGPFSYEQTEDLLRDFDHIVFCEGHEALNNPYFPDLPWQIAKGEACIVRIEHPDAFQIDSMLKKTATLVPLGNGRFWCGATFEWNYPHTLPTIAQQQELKTQISEMIAVPFEVETALAAIRPTNKERRPFLLPSPINNRLWMFNGLGTKGGLLAPYFADALTKAIVSTGIR